MFAGSLARLQGASQVQAVEAGCSGAAESMEILAPSPVLSSSGHSDRLALSSSQRGLPASLWHCDSAAGS